MSLRVKEIVANTIDDINDVVTEAITESESNDESDDNTETESIKTPSLKMNLVLARHAVNDTKDIESNTQTDSDMETKADSEGQLEEPNVMYEVESTEAIKAPSLNSKRHGNKRGNGMGAWI